MSELTNATLLEQYIAALQSHGAVLERSDDLGSKEQAVFSVDGLGYLLVTLTADTPGLWRLEQQRVTLMQQRAAEASLQCRFALLIRRRDGRGANGYILFDFTSTPVKREPEHEDGKIIIREKKHLDSLRLILSTDKQAELLLRKWQ